MNSTRHRAVGEYIRELQRSMRELPANHRNEIVAEIEEHISEGLAELPNQGEANVRNLLERLGDPQDIAAEARERFGIDQADKRVDRVSSRAKWLVGAAGLTVIGIVVGVLLMSGRSRPSITEEQFSRVSLGDSRDEVTRALGGSGEEGSRLSGLDPQAVEAQLQSGQEQYDDCWSYSVDGPGVSPGSEAAVCFIADEAVYTAIRTD